MRIPTAVCVAAAAAGILSGCFDEPVKADGRVPPESRIYMKDGKAEVFSAGLLLRRGVDANGERLAGRFRNIDPAKVEYLNLDRNSLTNIDEIAAFKSLRWLRLNDNKLESVPDLSHLARLEKIYLAGNRLREVPPFLEALPELEMIDMSGNPVAEIPEWLARKSGLRHLDLSRTALRSLPADLGAWKSLRSLKLGDLRLDESEMRRIRSALPGVRIVF